MERGPGGRSWTPWLAALALAALAAGVYPGVGDFDFVYWDDSQYLVDNVHVREGLRAENIAWALTSTEAANWHPLTWWSHMLDYELFGADPGAHHLSALAWHVLCTLLLFRLFWMATGQLGASFAVAALFGVHPIHVESVAWVSERKDLVSTAFALLAMMAHVGWVRHGGALRWSAVALCMALSLMAKPTYVTLPFLLLLLDFWPLERAWSRRIVLEKVPHLLLSAGSAWMTLLAQQGGGAVATQVAFLDRAGNAAVSYVRYLGKMAWPAELTVHYPYPGWHGLPAHSTAVVVACLAFLAIATAALLASRRRPLIFGWLWFGMMLGPMIGLIQVGTQAMAERYAYLPLAGPLVMLCFGATDFASRVQGRDKILRGAAGLALAIMVLAAGARTVQHVPTWRDSGALFRNAVTVTPDHPLMLNNLAWWLATHPDPRRRDPAEALVLAQRAVELTNGQDASSLDTLAVAHAALGDFSAARRVGLRALSAARARTPGLVPSLDANLAAYAARRPVRDETYTRLARPTGKSNDAR